MATSCPRCGKKSQLEWKRKLLRGNYNPTHKVRKYPNLQWARFLGKRIKACTQCIKGMYKTI